ncbi:hypothetical protein ACH5A3_02865 [Streptomyces echinatus]|uniref:hypothetical protein n=1 Tax=Streptomyces echinatus TaxID=67293 RepID=UPI0037B279E4
MDRETVTLNNFIQTQLSEIAEDLWSHHRVIQVSSGEARFLQVGTGVTLERWQCQQTHGSSPCGQPLVPLTEALILLGCCDYLPVPDDELKHELIAFRTLDPDFGFTLGELMHYFDLLTVQEQYGLAVRGGIVPTRKSPKAQG